MSAPLHCAVKVTPFAGIVYVEPAATVLLPSLQPRKFTVGSAFGPDKATRTVNLTGLMPNGISKHSVSVGGTYSIDAGSGNTLILHSDYQWNSDFTIAQGLPNTAAVESLNASIAFVLESGLEFSIWGRNLTEPKYNSVLFPSVAQLGSVSGYPSPPSFYGVSVKYKF
jgi:outer membrane receptor protein involved in Fe transport